VNASRVRYLLGVFAMTGIVATIIGGLVLLGSPGEERLRRLDVRRVQDLSAIARAADVYWTRHARVPFSLTDLAQQQGAGLASTDPSTRAAYEYRALDATHYELCATFQRESSEQRAGTAYFWVHPAGRQCFQREAQRIGP
jgi:hypothetical protein